VLTPESAPSSPANSLVLKVADTIPFVSIADHNEQIQRLRDDHQRELEQLRIQMELQYSEKIKEYTNTIEYVASKFKIEKEKAHELEQSCKALKELVRQQSEKLEQTDTYSYQYTSRMISRR
jgi:Fe2+ transport system protein B